MNKSTGEICDLSCNRIGWNFIDENKGLLSEIVRIEKLKVLDLSQNEIDDIGVETLAKICGAVDGRIPSEIPLKELKLCHNQLTSKSYLALQPFFRHLNGLDLSENPLSDAFIRDLVLSDPDPEIPFTLKTLTLNNCGLTPRTPNLLKENLALFPFLPTLNI